MSCCDIAFSQQRPISAFVLQPCSFTGPSKCPKLTQRRRRRLVQPQARISDSLPFYRMALLKHSRNTKFTDHSRKHTPEKPSTEFSFDELSTHNSTTSTANSALFDKTARLAFSKRQLDLSSTRLASGIPIFIDTRYAIRIAKQAELYTAADIRCEAFYCAPSDVNYRPIRRREIYMAMQSRVGAGTCCVVLIDIDPPPKWRSLASSEGLVVGTLDVTLHCSQSGKRTAFNSAPFDPYNDCVCAYLSSMAVRQDWQSRGLAQHLLSYTKHLVGQLGVCDVFLHVDWENTPAVHIYSKHGFRKVRHPTMDWIHDLAKPEHTLMYLPLARNLRYGWNPLFLSVFRVFSWILHIKIEPFVFFGLFMYKFNLILYLN